MTTLLTRITLLLSTLALIGASPPTIEQHATFAPTQADFPNPERGFYDPAPGDLATLDAAFVHERAIAGTRLLYVRIDLSAYRDRALPESYLRQLARGFAAVRETPVKLILRATYNYPQGETDYHQARDAPLAIVRTHLRQLSPLLHDNKDVIAFVQAGFIGAWGEWHSSSNGLATPANKRAVRDALLAAVPDDRFVMFRYPPDLLAWSQEPEWRSALAPRIGFHNDCFLASETDVGTFPEDDDGRLRALVDRLGDNAPFGGETCNPADDPDAHPRTACADILAEGARYNLVYLNSSYYRRLFHDRWREQGCMDEVARRMGYRVELKEAWAPRAIVPGRAMQLRLSLGNIGWARPFLPRPPVLLLTSKSSGRVWRIRLADADWRAWAPGEVRQVLARTVVPQKLPAGRYDLALALPDPAHPDDPLRAVRFANADLAAAGQRWSPASGAFELGLSVTAAILPIE